jgi:hypothetical protein
MDCRWSLKEEGGRERGRGTEREDVEAEKRRRETVRLKTARP